MRAIPCDDWCRTWAAVRTIMLRRISKRVKEVKIHLPAVVRLSRSFWDDAKNGTAAEKLQFVLRLLAVLEALCRINTLELSLCEITGQDTERLGRVLVQCPALAYLDLSGNSNFVSSGAEIFAGLLTQCTALDHLDLSNGIEADAAERLRASWCGQTSGFCL